MTPSDEPATVADIERDTASSAAAARLRRRTLAIVVGLAALGALAASALAPSLGDDDPAPRTTAVPARPAPARPVPSPHGPAPRVEAEEPEAGARQKGVVTIPVRRPRPSLPPP